MGIVAACRQDPDRALEETSSSASSAMDELKESIDRKIVVKRGRNGSSVSIEA
ncbi:MAG: hypothetical protein ACLT98_09330 [Eggerthellaceae bacterium]